MVRACRVVRSIRMWRRGRAWIGVLAGIGASVVVGPAVAQSPPAPDVGSSDTGSLTGTPSPTALSPGAGDELTFSSHGFIRAPMRMGVGHRPSCPPGVAAGTLVTPGGSPLPSGVEPSAIPGAPPPKAAVFPEMQCAGAGQSNVDFHSPRLPDDQYLDPRYTRQWEKDWTEVFFNYGNSHVVGTVSFQAFGLSDAEHVSVDNLSSQLGIAQAWVTLTPTVDKLRLDWKVGAFWDKYGMSGKDDAGKYDMYLFGRTHLMGQTLGGEYPIGDVIVRASEGFGVKNEELEFTPVSYGFPGYTLVAHVHAGASYKKVLTVNVHYISAFAQDARVQGPAAISTQLPASTTANLPDGHIDIAGVEARLSAGALGDLYLGYSHLSARQAEQVGPAIEPISSLGGYSGGTQNAALPGSSAAMVGSNYYGPNQQRSPVREAVRARLRRGKLDPHRVARRRGQAGDVELESHHAVCRGVVDHLHDVGVVEVDAHADRRRGLSAESPGNLLPERDRGASHRRPARLQQHLRHRREPSERLADAGGPTTPQPSP